jgi:hypothetical protein
MKHATPRALVSVLDLLNQIRTRKGLHERKPGIFYKKSRPFLHFHEDPTGMYADLNVGGGFDRYPVNTENEWKLIVATIDHILESD